MSTTTVVTPSTTRANVAHTVTVDVATKRTTCTCEAGSFGLWCRHAEHWVRELVDAEARAWCLTATDPELERRAAAVLKALVEARLQLAAAKSENRKVTRDERERVVRGACWLDATGDELWVRSIRETRAA